MSASRETPGGRLPLVLASASPRRAELLQNAGISFDVVVADVDESVVPGERADAYVRRVAAAKAARVAESHPNRAVLGADTTVVVDGVILGKPLDEPDAARMLTLLSGRTHTVLTALCLRGPAPAAPREDVASTMVEFLPLSPDDIAWYIASGEPMDKAGGYAIQGLGSRFVARIDGSYSNVVGLPVALLWSWLRGGD